MVNALTAKEEQHLQDYDAITEKQLRDEAKQRDFFGPNVSDLYRIMEAQDMEHIGELHLDIGTMRAVLERFPDDDPIQQMAEYFIRVDMNIIENLTEEIQHERKQAEEFERV